MYLELLFMLHHKKIIIVLSLLLVMTGCTNRNISLLEDSYNNLNETVQNVLDYKTNDTYSGKYFTIKLKYAIKYKYNNNDVYVYKLLIAPIYNMKTVVTGIKLESNLNSKELADLYYEMNFSFENLDAKTHTYEKLDEFVGEYYEFAIVDNSKQYYFNMSESEFENALNDFNLIITINGQKDKINISNFNIIDYDENVVKSDLIDLLITTGRLSATIGPYILDEK